MVVRFGLKIPSRGYLVGILRLAEQFSQVTEFSIRTEQSLQILFLAYSSLDNCIRLEYVLFYQFDAKITTFFDQEMFGLTPLLYVVIERFGGN